MLFKPYSAVISEAQRRVNVTANVISDLLHTARTDHITSIALARVFERIKFGFELITGDHIESGK